MFLIDIIHFLNVFLLFLKKLISLNKIFIIFHSTDFIHYIFGQIKY